MNFYKMKWKLGFCVRNGCFSRGINKLEFTGVKNGKKTVLKCGICEKHTHEFLNIISSKGIEMKIK